MMNEGNVLHSSFTIHNSPLKFMFCQKCGTQNPDNGKFCRACGSDLGNASVTADRSFMQPIQPMQPAFYVDRKGRIKSNDPDELWAGGIRSLIMGVGFIIIALALLITNVAGGHGWWWSMLFPAFSMLGIGASHIARSKRITKRQSSVNSAAQNQLPNVQTPQNLPPTSAQTDYVKSQRKSIYDTGELLAPPSVTEGTTRHLEINNEGETMTLPKTER
jgi:hypothetical protein